jgi:magnesium transporter
LIGFSGILFFSNFFGVLMSDQPKSKSETPAELLNPPALDTESVGAPIDGSTDALSSHGTLFDQTGNEPTELSSGETTTISKLLEDWPRISDDLKEKTFRDLEQGDAEDLYLALTSREQAILMRNFSRAERRLWIRFLAPDDAADLIQEVTGEMTATGTADLRSDLLDMVDQSARREIIALLSYREDEAGGLMSTRFVRVRPDMEIAQAIRYVRQQVQVVEPAHYVYVLDSQQKLFGVMSLRQIFLAAADRKVSDIMETKIVVIPAEMDQERVSQIFTSHRFVALPVVDAENRMQGVVTVDDILDVNQEEATEDIQKLGGSEALDSPYPQVSLPEMIRKRAGWLVVLFVGEMFTASAMKNFEGDIKKAVVLSLFIPLIISSGGNSGSQATTLIIRSMALKELRLSDWWRVLVKEMITGLSLGILLALIGMTRIFLWPYITGEPNVYTEHVAWVSLTVGISLVGVVCYGTLVGSMLPFLLRKLRLDPASASAPMVATLVDVTGLVIYFNVAQVVLAGRLL